MFELIVPALIATVGLLQAVLLWRLIRGLSALKRLESRAGHFADALSLLTDTTESGFRATALEIGRLSALGTRSAASSRTTTTRRAVRAAKNGRTVPEIAADEQVSEGEIRLRLHLAEPTPPAHRILA